MKKTPFDNALGISGYFFSENGYIADTAFAGGNAERIQSLFNGTYTFPVIGRSFRISYICIIHVSEIVIHGSPARNAPNDRDPRFSQSGNADFAANILTAADDDGGRIAPKKNNIFIPKRIEDIFLERLIVKRVV